MIFTFLLDRIYSHKEAITQEQVCDFFVDEVRAILSKELITSDDIDIICFILQKNHSIFDYRGSSNGPQLAPRLAKKRYPDNDDLAQQDTDFVLG